MADPIMGLIGNKDYSPYQQNPDENLYTYLARLASTREGGILGTKGLMDAATAPTPAKTIDPTADPSLGILTSNCPIDPRTGKPNCNLKSDGNDVTITDPYEGSKEQLAGFSRADFEMQNALDRLTGRAYAGQGLLYGIPHLLSNWADTSKVESALVAAGYTPEEASRLANDPELASATNALGRMGTMPTHEYDYKQQNTQTSLWDVGTSIVGSIFGLDKQSDTPEYSRQSPFATPEQFSSKGYWGSPLQSNARTAQIVAAQNKSLFDPFAAFNLDALTKQAQSNAEAEAARTAAMSAALEQANVSNSSSSSGNSDWGSSGYHSDSSGSYTGGSDYGGWTGVTADGSGNDWNSF